MPHTKNIHLFIPHKHHTTHREHTHIHRTHTNTMPHIQTHTENIHRTHIHTQIQSHTSAFLPAGPGSLWVQGWSPSRLIIMGQETFPAHILLQSWLRSPGKATCSDSNQKKTAGGRVARKTEWEGLPTRRRGCLPAPPALSTPDVRMWDRWIAENPKARRKKKEYSPQMRHCILQCPLRFYKDLSATKELKIRSTYLLDLPSFWGKFYNIFGKTYFSRHTIMYKKLFSHNLAGDEVFVSCLPSRIAVCSLGCVLFFPFPCH